MKKKTVYFNFKELSKPMGEATVFNYVGWSGLNVTKFFIPKGKKITNSLINEFHPDLNNKEKIFFTTEGNIELKIALPVVVSLIHLSLWRRLIIAWSPIALFS